jgi:hypothetical protein
MILEIKFDASEGLNLYINGLSEHIYIDYDSRVKALRKANDIFDTDLNLAALLYPESNKGAFLWCYTSEFLRSENMTDLIKLYYIIELIKELKSIQNFTKIYLYYYIPNDAIKQIIDLGIRTIKTSKFYRGKIREWLKVGFHAFKSFKINLASFIALRNTSHSGNLIDINQSPKNNRLDPIENFEFYKPYHVFSGQEHKITGFDQSQIVVFRNENNFLDAIIIFLKAVNISYFLLKSRRKLPKVYRSYFRFRDIFILWSLLLYKNGAKKYFVRNAIKNLVHVSTLTKPEYRILWSTAKNYLVKVILVSSRTLKSLSSSERLIKADIEGYSQTVLPDYMVVRDNFSRDLFKNIPICQNILVGGRSSNLADKEEVNLISERVLYIVLTHIKGCSDFFLSELSSINFKEFDISKIFFRCHPAVNYTKEEIAKYFKGYELINHTGVSIQKCVYDEIIMVSGPTTGALELIKKGVFLYWFPYIWKDGILFDDLMNTCGYKASTIGGFYLDLSNFKRNTHKDSQLLLNHFNSSEFLISNQIKKFL